MSRKYSNISLLSGAGGGFTLIQQTIVIELSFHNTRSVTTPICTPLGVSI